VCQGLELQHVRRRSGAMRLRNTTGSRGTVRSMLFFESTRFHVVRRRFRRSSNDTLRRRPGVVAGFHNFRATLNFENFQLFAFFCTFDELLLGN